MSKVSIIMGSIHDLDKIQPAIDLFHSFDVEVDVVCYSAHRALNGLVSYIEQAKDTEVFIAAAGMAAALPGVVASQTVKPVIGLPLTSKVLDGMDALYSIVQMPPGIPVGTVGIDNSKNAAILAMQILALKDEALRKKLIDDRSCMHEKAKHDNCVLQEKLKGGK